MKSVAQIAGVLVLVGALNWGLVGLLGLNLVTTIFGEGSMLTSLVYDLVGLSALLVAYDMYFKGKK